MKKLLFCCLAALTCAFFTRCVSHKLYNSLDQKHKDLAKERASYINENQSLKIENQEKKNKLEQLTNELVTLKKLNDSLIHSNIALTDNNTQLDYSHKKLDETRKATLISHQKEERSFYNTIARIKDSLHKEKEKITLEKRKIQKRYDEVEELKSYKKLSFQKLNKIKFELTEALLDYNKNRYTIEQTDTFLVLTIENRVLFKTLSRELLEEGERICRSIKTVFDNHPTVKITVQSHTDQGTINADNITDSWDLTSLQSAAIIRFVFPEALAQKRITLAAKGHFFPRKNTPNASGDEQNNRTEFIFYPSIKTSF